MSGTSKKSTNEIFIKKAEIILDLRIQSESLS
jgi:hypothetical protein